MDILLKDITLNEKRSDILISNGLISRITDSAPAVPDEGTEIYDCSGKAAVPGFINMHTHSAMSLMRGIGEDIFFNEWIRRIWEVESHIDEEFIYWGTKVACIEMMRTGTTTFNDHYWMPETGLKAALESGLRPAVSYVLLDNGDKEKAALQRDRCMEAHEFSKHAAGKCKFAVGIHAVYSVLEDNITWAAEYARKHGLPIHIHISETEREVTECKAAHGGLSPVAYLDRLGVLGPDTIAAHTLWLSDEDIEILGRRRVNCVHNINSNLKISSGYKFKYEELRGAGANVCIGTDGCASSNNLDMLEAMKTSALLQKAWRKNPSAMPLDELMCTATANGAKALGIDTGSIAEGKIADISIVDTDSSFFLSPGSFLGNFIYSAHSDCISSVLVDGKFVMKDRKIDGEQDILRNAKEMLGKIHNR